MFLLRRNLDECIAVFKQLAQRVFRPRQPFGSSPLAKVYGFLSSLLTDSLYGAAEMEACVKEAFGSDAPLFGFTESGTRMSGAKVAVTTMTVSSARLCILSTTMEPASGRVKTQTPPLEIRLTYDGRLQTPSSFSHRRRDPHL
jgi:hypothetical protein